MNKKINSYEYVMAAYIKNLRQQQGIGVNQLCGGLCSESTFIRFEKRERTLPYETLGRILERLGNNIEDVHIYLEGDEYDKWACRTKVIYFIIKEDYNSATEILERYKEQYPKKTKLEEQFYYRMKAMIEACQDGEREIIADNLRQALARSVVDISPEGVAKEALSIQEIDMLLDYYRYTDVSAGIFRQIISYICDRKWENVATCKILPKAIYYYYLALCEEVAFDSWGIDQLIMVEKIVSESIDEQRKIGSLCFLWELLTIREGIYHAISDKMELDQITKKRAEDNSRWKAALEWLYKDQHIPERTINTAIYYMTFNVENLGKALRKRRKMLGLSVSEIAEGVMDQKTVYRIETGEVKGQKYHKLNYLERVGLPNQLIHDIFITDNLEERDLFMHMRKAKSRMNYEEGWCDLLTLKEDYKCKLTYNEQILRWYELAYLVDRRKIENGDALLRIRESAELSVNWKSLTRAKHHYYSYVEIPFLKLYFQCAETFFENENVHEELEAIEKYCFEYVDDELRYNHFKSMLSVGAVIQSVLGNVGEYEKSNKWCKRIIDMSLACRKLRRTVDIRYAMWWNKREEEKTTDVVPLSNLATLSNMLMKYEDEQFFLNKMYKVGR